MIFIKNKQIFIVRKNSLLSPLLHLSIIIDLHFRIQMNCIDNLLSSNQNELESYILYPVD